MAIMKMTAIVAAIKGKISGTVFQTSPMGQVARKFPNAWQATGAGITHWGRARHQAGARTTNISLPIIISEASSNPDIVGFTFFDGSRNANLDFPTQQSIISQLSTRWRNLDPAQKDSWTSGAVNFPFKNKFGETYTGSGYQVYQSLNTNLINSLGVILDVCPIPAEVSAPTVVMNWDDPLKAAIMLAEFPDGIPEGTIVEFWATPQRSAGRNTNLNSTLLAVFAPQEAFNVPLLYAYQSKFGPVQANGKLKTVFGGKGQISGQRITINNGALTFTTESAGPLASLSENDRLISPGAFLSTIALGNLSSSSEYNFKRNLYGTKFGDPWKLQMGGADAALVTLTFNGEVASGGVVTGACDAFGDLPGYVLDFVIDTSSLGAKSATLTLSCAAIGFSQTCTITWTAIL